MHSHTRTTSMPRFTIWAIWLIVSIFYAYQYILRVMPSVMMNDIMQQFNIDTATFGQFSGVYYIGYACMHLPLGIMLDRFGPKKIMPLCIIITVVGLMPIMFAKHWLFAIIGRCLIGIGSSAAILSAFKVIRSTFSKAQFTRMLSFTVTIGLIGAIYGGGPVNYLCEMFGYKYVTGIFAGVGVALSLIAYFITPELQAQQSSAMIEDIKSVFKNTKVIVICCLAGMMVGPLEGFADVWGKEFLSMVYGFDGTVAASLTSAIFVGMCFGSPVLSYIAAKIKNDSLAIVGAGMLMSISFIALLAGGINAAMLSLVFTIVGVCCAYQIIAIFKASTYVQDKIVGLTTAMANMIIMLFGYAFHSIIGLIINLAGGNNSNTAFMYGIAVIPVTLFIGTIGFALIWWQESRATSNAAITSTNI